MKTDVVKPQAIFYSPTRLIVPLFQRPYVWSKETQWQPLWEDIVRLIEVIDGHDETATHFLGAIVTQAGPSRFGSLPTWNVIDGQQRLTTLQLLLDALHSELESRGFAKLASRILPLIENSEVERNSEEERFKLWPTNRDREGYAAVMSAPSPIDYAGLPPSRMRDGHRYFAEAIGEWLGDGDDAEERAQKLAAAITTRLEIASITLDANEDAQAIFETLNARGTPLSAADLIKNFVFQQLPESQTEAAYRDYWADFETPWWEAEVTTGRVKHTRASLFLWQWLVARTLDDFPIREVFTQFKHYVTTQAGQDTSSVLPSIKRAADRYRAIIDGAAQPLGELSRVELFAYRVGTLDSEIARPLLIWFDEPEQQAVTEEDRNRILELLESWFVRRALVKAHSQGSNRFLVELLRHLDRTPHDALVAATEEFLAGNHTTVGYWPGDEEVRAALTEGRVYGSYRQSRVRMVFEALEDARRGYPNGNAYAMGPIVRGKATIEHIMPQKWRKNWYADLSEDEQTTRDWRIQQLGNLTIVTQALNSKVSNGPWETKREFFDQYGDVLLSRDIVKVGPDAAWDEGAIQKRTQNLIEEILAVWPAPEGHVGLAETTQASTEKTYVDLAQLVDAGWIEAGAKLEARSTGVREGFEAVVAKDGRIYIDDVPYDYPSGAARSVLKKPYDMNGWWFWFLAGTERRLSHVREDYLASLGEADVEVVEEELDDDGSVGGAG